MHIGPDDDPRTTLFVSCLEYVHSMPKIPTIKSVVFIGIPIILIIGVVVTVILFIGNRVKHPDTRKKVFYENVLEIIDTRKKEVERFHPNELVPRRSAIKTITLELEQKVLVHSHGTHGFEVTPLDASTSKFRNKSNVLEHNESRVVHEISVGGWKPTSSNPKERPMEKTETKLGSVYESIKHSLPAISDEEHIYQIIWPNTSCSHDYNYRFD